MHITIEIKKVHIITGASIYKSYHSSSLFVKYISMGAKINNIKHIATDKYNAGLKLLFSILSPHIQFIPYLLYKESVKNTTSICLRIFSTYARFLMFSSIPLVC